MRTAKGARAGTTISAVRQLYGSSLQTVDRWDEDYGHNVRYYQVVEGSKVLIFKPSDLDPNVVEAMYAAPVTTPYYRIWCH